MNDNITVTVGGRQVKGETEPKMSITNDRDQVTKYRKKPVVIEAMKWNGENLHAISKFCQGDAYMRETCESGNVLVIKTLEGQHIASIGDWIIKGVAGEFYPCKPDIFKATYEPVNEAKE